MWKRSDVGGVNKGSQRRVLERATLALSVLLSAGCGSDTFDGGDAGTSTSTGQQSNTTATSGATSTGTNTVSEQTVPVCNELCRSQVEAGCHDLFLNPDDCGLVCGFLDELSEDCQEATRVAFQCQLDKEPCSTAGCNDLLKAAETVCPPLPEF